MKLDRDDYATIAGTTVAVVVWMELGLGAGVVAGISGLATKFLVGVLLGLLAGTGQPTSDAGDVPESAEDPSRD